MKNIILFVGLAIIIIMTDNYLFENQQQRQSFYPPTVDFKEAVDATLTEKLPDKIFDLMWDIPFYYITIFESLDGYDLQGNVPTLSPVNFPGVRLQTAASLNSFSSMTKWISDSSPADILLNKKIRAKFRIETGASLSNITANFTIGTFGISETYFGFELSGTTLSGSSSNPDTTSSNAIALKTLAINTAYVLEVRYEPNKKVIFLIDGIEVGSLTSELPYDNGSLAYMFEAYVRTTNTLAKALYLTRYSMLIEN